MLLTRATILFAICFSFSSSVIADNTVNNPTAHASNPSESLSQQLRPRKRGQNQQVQLPSAWSINANEDGTLCYIDPEQVLLWRDNASSASRLLIKTNGSQKPLNLRWAKNQDTLKWPYTRVKLIPDNTYYVKLNRDATLQVITSKQLPAELWNADKAEQIAWMQANDCPLQAHFLQQTTIQQ